MDDRSDSDREQNGSVGMHHRSTGRDSMFLQATITCGGRAPLQLRVRNLSAGGMMAESESGFAEGEQLTIELRSVGSIGGRVAWVRDGRIGVAFDQPIDPKLARKAPPKSALHGMGARPVPVVASIKRPKLTGG